MSKLTIIGIGPGSEGYVMPAAKTCMEKSHTVIAAKRVLPMLQSVLTARQQPVCLKQVSRGLRRPFLPWAG